MAYRLRLIEEARQTLDVVCFTIDNDESGQLIYGALLAAGDRGVQVRLLIDGFFHRFRFAGRKNLYALLAHPNVTLRYFEPVNLLKPWTWNNLLHDKYTIVDDRLALMGGRNIEDRFFQADFTGEIVRDRDVLVYNSADRLEDSVISQMKDYFELKWTHETVQAPSVRLTAAVRETARETNTYLQEHYQTIRPRFAPYLTDTGDWSAVTWPTRKVTLIHNPIERFNKYPTIWAELNALLALSEDSVFYQSPYVIPTWQMRLFLDQAVLEQVDVHILTNSLAASPNFSAMAGYYKHRARILAATTSLYEYQGPGSIHAKSLLMDNRISMVGSFNLDSRSAYMSTESMLVIDSEVFATHLADQLSVLIDESLPVTDSGGYPDDLASTARPVPLYKQMLLGLLMMLLCLFDFFL